MKLNSEPVRNWFGYTRRERRSSSILLSLILVIILLRSLLPEKNIEIVQFGILPSDTANNQESSERNFTEGRELFAFDPNSASYDTLIKLGFDPGEAKTLIRYRTRGGKFRNPGDIRKVFGIDSTLADNLEPYVEVSSYSSQKKEFSSADRKKPLLNLNSCDSISLVALPGIGPILSARIIKYRNLLGGFARIEQLKEVYGLPEETYEMIKGRLFADTSMLRKTSVNSSGFRDLSRIPYLEKYEVTAILKFVELAGRVNSIDDLKTNKILSPEKADKVEAYIDFR